MPVPEAASLPTRADAVRVLRAVNDHWIATHPDPGHNRWDRATYFSGDMALERLVGERRYRGYAARWAEAHRWGLNGGPATRNADNQCAGQAYLDLYALRPEPRRIAAIARSVRNMVYGPDKDDDWSWVDALHMAMPCFVRLGGLRREPGERGRYWRKLYRLYDHTKRREGGGLYERRPGHPRQAKNAVPLVSGPGKWAGSPRFEFQKPSARWSGRSERHISTRVWRYSGARRSAPGSTASTLTWAASAQPLPRDQ